MATHRISYPEAATLKRRDVVHSLIKQTFAVAYSHLSQLQGRTIKKFCNDENIPKYICNFFKENEKTIMASGTPVQEYEVQLTHKLLKTCCGLKRHYDIVWGSVDETNTLEFLITFCWTEYNSLGEAPQMTDNDLNLHLDRVLEALILFIEKVEEQKGVDESALKGELSKHIGGMLDLQDDGLHCQHIYTILSQHSVHQMLVIVYLQLNNLKGMPLSKYLNYRKINLTPRTLLSNEHKFLEQDPPPQKMSISVLYRVLQRVCFGFNPRNKKNHSDVLELILRKVKWEYNTPPANEEEYPEKSYKIYKLLKDALVEVSKKTGKSQRKIIQSLPKEPFVVESFRKPFELPTYSSQPPLLPSDPSPCSSKESPSGLPDSPVTLPSAPFPAMHLTTSTPAPLTEEEINIIVLFKVICPGGVAARTLAHVFIALKGDLGCIKQNKKNYKNSFTKDEKVQLEEVQYSAKMDDLLNKDITFLCKVLRNGCALLSSEDDVWSTPGNTLEYFITFIRKERNKFSHEVKAIPTIIMNKTLHNIQTYLDTIFELTEQKLQENEQDMKIMLRQQRCKVRSEMHNISHSLPHSSYLLTLTKMKEEMTNKMKLEARKELQQMHIYQDNPHYMLPINSNDKKCESLTTQDVFVDRELEDRSDIKAEGTYKTEDIVFSEDNALASIRVIVIHGRPGDGKTSLCKYAFHLWSCNVVESSQKGVELLIYISCRYVTTESISAHLKQRLRKTFENIDKDDIVPLLQESQILFVVDGYDETGGEAKGLIDDILVSLPDSRMIITTKTQWAPSLIQQVESKTSCYKILSMVEMTDEMRQQYIRKIFNAMQQNKECDNFLEYIDRVKEKIEALIDLPLTCSLLSLLWIENPKNVKQIQTSAQLYHKLTDLILERVSAKIKKKKFCCQEWMKKLGKLAWDKLKKNQHHLNENDITTLTKRACELELGIEGNDCILSNLLHCDIHNNLVDTVKRWNFVLTSQQEYFAAEYIVDSLMYKDSLNESLSKILELNEESEEKLKKKLQRLVPVIEYVSGLLAIHEGITKGRVKEMIEIMSVKEPWAFKAVEKIFEHVLQNSDWEHAVKTLFMNQEMNTFEGYDPQNLLWVVKSTSLAIPCQVTLRNTVSDVLHMKPLLEFLLKSGSRSVKVMVDIDKASSIPGLAKFMKDTVHKGLVFACIAWKPLCIAEVVRNWPWPSPLCLTLRAEVFPLLWWDLAMCLLSLDHKVTKIVYSSCDPRLGHLLKEGVTWLGAHTDTDSTLAPTDLVIHCT